MGDHHARIEETAGGATSPPLTDAECTALARMGLAAERNAAAELDVEAGLRRFQPFPPGVVPPIRPRPLRRWAAWAAAAALVLAMVVGALSWWRPASSLAFVIRSSGEAGSEGMWLHTAAGDTLQFDDGTSITLGENTRLRAGSLDRATPRLFLERGEVHAAVQQGTGARWHIDAGPFTVEVTGTVFELAWLPDADSFELTLHEGSVRLQGPVVGPGRRVVAGERLRVFPAAGRLLTSRSDTPAATRPLPASTLAAATATAAATMTTATTATAVTAASAAASGFKPVLQRASARELLLLGQAARLRGQPKVAVAALEATRRRFPWRAEARTATFLLGKMAFDEGRDEEAVARLHDYLVSAPNGPFAPEATALLAVARERRRKAQDDQE